MLRLVRARHRSKNCNSSLNSTLQIDPDILPALKGRGFRAVAHATRSKLVPALAGRLARYPSTGFNALSARRSMLIAAFVPQAEQISPA